jgi:O-antigen/teichoic acid export membrane protein
VSYKSSSHSETGVLPAKSAAARREFTTRRVFASLRKTAVHPGPVLGAFSSLVGSQLGGAALGLVFWMIATHALSPEQIGVGASLVAAMTLFSWFGALGVGTLLLERFKIVSVADRRVLLSTGLSIAGTGAAVVAAAWLVLSAFVHIPGVLGEISLGTALLLVGTTAIAAICSTFDLAVLGLGASRLQLRRNLLAGALRIAVLSGALAAGISSGQVILVAWTVGLLGSLLATPLRRHLSPRTRIPATQRLELVRNYWTVAIGHHGLTLAITSSPLILPVVVASIMSATEVAYYSQARLLADTLLALLYLLTIALFASVENFEAFRRRVRQILLMGMALALTIVAGGALFGRILLQMFGSNYAQNSLPLLMIILMGGPAILIKDLFVVLRRLQGLRRQGAITMGLWSAAELAAAVAGGLVGGLPMLCIGWAAVTTVCALIALPVLLKAVHTQPTGRVPGRDLSQPEAGVQIS